MTWPTSDIDTTHADAGTDSPSLWRAAALALSQAFNQVRNHVSAYMQGVLEAANASAARTALGFTAVGSNVATAADAAAARSAIGATAVGSSVLTAADAAAARTAISAVGTTGDQTVAGFKLFSGGLLSVSPSFATGYGAGAGIQATQTTSKSTGVFANRPCGRIVTHNAALAAGASVTFLVSGFPDNQFNEYSLVHVATSFHTRYRLAVTPLYNVGGGARGFSVYIHNVTGSSYSDAIDIVFSVENIALS